MSARAAYQSAWGHREAGEFPLAVAVAESGLVRVGEALAENPDLTARVELNDLRSRLTTLRDGAQKDGQAAGVARSSGNEADEKVLNAPATEAIDPQINDDVLKWIEFFTGNGRSTFEKWLKRSGRYMELFRQALQKEGLPPDLVHLVFVESGFNLNARSVSAAVGPWQFLRSTGRLFGLTVNQWVDERKDPEKSTVAAARYLKHLYSIFGDWPLALASYNAGEGTVLRAIRRQGTSNYWDLRLPRQTEDYVPQFMAVLAISRDPEKYGFDEVPLDEPMEFDQVALKGAVDLRALAKVADCSYEDLKLLNPAVLRHAAPGSSGVTTVRVPRGKGEVLMARLQEGASLPAVDLTLKHKVRRGETLQGIANQYHVSARQLALANGIGRKRPLRRGIVITVPASLTSPSPALLDPDDPRALTNYVPRRNITPPRSLNAESNAEGRLTHTVRRGETLGMVAQKYGVTVAEIKQWNRLKANSVRRGTRLKIRTLEGSPTLLAEVMGPPAPATDASADGDDESLIGATDAAASELSDAPKSATPTSPRMKTIVVHRGDTLGRLAERHGVTIGQIKRANGMKSSQVRAGQRLKIPNS
jgi:membrane-bound lytic murein transglycosylase D